MKPSFEKVAKEDEGVRLDKWFKEYHPEISFILLQKLLRKNAVKVDGKKAVVKQILSAGQEIRVPAVEHTQTLASKIQKTIDFDKVDALLVENILFKNSNLVVINKPPGLPVQGGSKVSLCVDDMLPALAKHLDGQENTSGSKNKIKLIHRIDKDTSGILMLARNAQTASLAGDSFKNKEFIKTYWALVVGVPPLEDGEIHLPLSPMVGAGNIEKMVVDEDNGKKSITHYHVIEKLSNDLSWVAMQPISGRKHQLRVHMASIGHPIVGDGKYGGKEAFIDGLSKKLHLHARRIEHPSFMGKALDITAPVPRHMKDSWKMFEFNSDDRKDYF